LQTSNNSRYQTSISKNKKVGCEVIVVGLYVFNKEATKCALVKMKVQHEYPMSIVLHKEFCLLYNIYSRKFFKTI